MRQSLGLVLKDIYLFCEHGSLKDGWVVDQGGRPSFTFGQVMLGGFLNWIPFL